MACARCKTYDAVQKLEAVERAAALCKRVAPRMIAQGQLTRGQMSNLLDVLSEVTFDYSAQAIDAKKLPPEGGTTLSDREISITLTRHSAD